MSISAIILAAGQSKRMGQPKLLLPWENTTVLGKVIETVQSAGVEDILVVTGGAHDEVEKIITNYNLRAAHNENFEQEEMLGSIQLGLNALLPPPPYSGTSPSEASLWDKSTRQASKNYSNLVSGFGGHSTRAKRVVGREGVLICLGDQPQVEERTVRTVVETFQKNKSSIVVPSYQMRRGHPWLIAKELWDEVLKMRAPETMRDFLNTHGNDIRYVEYDSPSILQDLDTPEDYLKYKPQS